MLHKVLVANRGEIAVRVIRACFDEDIRSVAAYSTADRGSKSVQLADESVCIGPANASQSYLSVPALVGAALATGCDGLHPGYGFLSERPELAAACAEHGIAFVGPSAETIRRGGDKIAARELAQELGIPVNRGTGHVDTVEAAIAAAEGQYPVLLKAAAGGGGRGMAKAIDRESLIEAFGRASLEAHQAFGDGRVFVERYVSNARHVEVQILADAHGNVVHVGDRDCSYQRRYQKIVEEAPASGISSEVRSELAEAAVALARGLDYVGAGTVEFLVDQDRCSFAFLEINARIQVEHPVTEAVCRVDLVREQLRIAGGDRLSFKQEDVEIRGHAIECRINAEDPRRGFLPSPGRVTEWAPPIGSGIRVDSHLFVGDEVSPHYDSLIGKLIVHADDRAAAVQLLGRALDRFQVSGVDTTLSLHRSLARHPDFQENRINIRWLEETFLPTWLGSFPSPALDERGRVQEDG
jgi:acetyl-CoA carboxylase biotin carboxylase subunit